MININLKTDGNYNKEKIEWGKALPWAVVSLALIGIIYGIIFFYTKKIKGETQTAEAAYNQKLNALKSESAKNIFDFQNRLNESRKMMTGNLNSNDNLREIEKTIITGVFVNSYKFDTGKKSLSLECIASNYSDVSKQILSFKKSDYFSDVSSGETNLSGQDGKINFKVELKIK